MDLSQSRWRMWKHIDYGSVALDVKGQKGTFDDLCMIMQGYKKM